VHRLHLSFVMSHHVHSLMPHTLQNNMRSTLRVNARRTRVQGASFMLSVFASSELLVSVFKGDQAQAQRVISLVGTATSLATFVAGPVAAGVMDSVGRRPFLIYGSTIIAAARLMVTLRPSVKVCAHVCRTHTLPWHGCPRLLLCARVCFLRQDTCSTGIGARVVRTTCVLFHSWRLAFSHLCSLHHITRALT
jgi:MFS family permease